jgi:hypothetical protein
LVLHFATMVTYPKREPVDQTPVLYHGLGYTGPDFLGHCAPKWRDND